MNPEPRLRTYLQSAALLLPPAVVAVGTALFLAPKLHQIYAASGAQVAAAHPLFAASSFLVNDGLWLLLGVGALLLALELRSNRWPRYRRGALLAAAVVLNSAVLCGLFAMLVCALLLAPALLPAR